MTVDQNPPPTGVSETQKREEALVSAHDVSPPAHSVTENLSDPPLVAEPEVKPEEARTDELPTAGLEGDAQSSTGSTVSTSGISHEEPVSTNEEPVPTVHSEGDALASSSASAPSSIGSDESKPTHDAEISQMAEVFAAPVTQPVDPEPAIAEPTAAEPSVPEPAAIEVEAVIESVAVEETPVVEAVFIQEEAPAEAVLVAAPRDNASDMDLFESYMSAMDRGEDPEAAIDSGYKRLQKGDRIEATIIQVDKDKVFVDLGTKAEGIIPLAELTEDNIESAKGLFNVGDKINVVVLRPEGAEGNPIVSKRRADFEEAWDRIEEAHRTQEMITAQVVDRVKGGLVVDVGVRGFVPATHVGSGKLRNIEKFVGQPLQLKVIEIDRERKKVVLSNRQAEEERRQSAKDEIFKAVRPGEILDGSVRRLTDYGAFVDLGGVDGLLHISEMSWARINHPKEMFKEGQKIKVMVLRLDEKAGKISLGHRQVLPDPWNLIKQNYKIGQTLKVIIGRIVLSGAFIKLPEGAEAFMPVSEMSYRRIKRPQEVVEENQEVEVQIIDLRPDERRMVLSMRALGGGGDLRSPSSSNEPQTFDGDGRAKDRGKKPGGKKGGRGGRDFDDDFEESVGRRGFATGGATIGERLGMLKGFLNRDELEDEKPAEEEGGGEEETKTEE
jgi:4-hydroxy-3-methylbut-2-enyl diphosphate reductase